MAADAVGILARQVGEAVPGAEIDVVETLDLDFGRPALRGGRVVVEEQCTLHQKTGWQAHGILWRCVLRSLEAALSTGDDSRPLDRRNVMVLGTGPMARALARGIARRKGLVSISGPDDKAAQAAAGQLEARFVPLASLYDTLADVVVVADAQLKAGHHRHELNPGWFRPSMTIADVTRLPEDTTFLREARERGCRVVEPATIQAEILGEQFRAVTGKPLPDGIVERVRQEAAE